MNINETETKELFWKIVKNIESCSDCYTKNSSGVITERGMLLSSDASVMYRYNDSSIIVYNEKCELLLAFTEESESLFILKDMFENLEV
jgi:hypothetical protein